MRPILVIDDDEVEGRRVRDLLISNKNRIGLIRDSSDPVVHVFPPTLFYAQLVSAKRHILLSDGNGFERIVAEMPSMVILDQFLPEDPSHGHTGTSLKLSRELLQLVSEVWELVLDRPTFGSLGWNLWVLMYTSQAERHMSEGVQPKVYDKSWFAYLQKPQPLSDRTPEQLKAEEDTFVSIINEMTRRDKTPDRSLKVSELFAGRIGHELNQATSKGFRERKPIWLVCGEKDGLDKVLLLLGFHLGSDALVVGEQDLVESFRAVADGRAREPAVFLLRDKLRQPMRLGYFAEQIEEPKLVVVSDYSLDEQLSGIFNAISVLPLSKWSSDDLNLLFRARYKCSVDRSALEWIHSQAFTYQHFADLALPAGVTIGKDEISRACPDLNRESVGLVLDLAAREAKVTWRDRCSVLSLGTNGGLCSIAILLARSRKSDAMKFGVSELLDALETFGLPKFEDFAHKFRSNPTFRQNHLSKGPGNAFDLLEDIFGEVPCEGKEYKSDTRFAVVWKSEVHVVLSQNHISD